MGLKHTHCEISFCFFIFNSCAHADKKPSGKSKDEQMAERKQELEKRLQDVTDQMGSSKNKAKKGKDGTVTK